MACTNPLTTLSRECGRNTAAAGVRDEIYLVSFDSLVLTSGSTEVYTTSSSNLVNAIAFASGATKFVKYGAIKGQNAIKETYTYNESGSYDIEKTLTFTLGNIGTVAAQKAVSDLVLNPVVALVKLRSGSWVIFGLNGQFSMSGADGSVDSKANNRVITLSGSDSDFLQVVDPTIVPSLLAA